MENNITKFYEAICKDERIKNRLGLLLDKHKELKSDESAVCTAITEFAKAEGFDFTAEQLSENVKTRMEEIDDDLLVNVTGGKKITTAPKPPKSMRDDIRDSYNAVMDFFDKIEDAIKGYF